VTGEKDFIGLVSLLLHVSRRFRTSDTPDIWSLFLSFLILSFSHPSLDALDSGANKSALASCNKLLKKHPNNVLLKVWTLPRSHLVVIVNVTQALKCLALLRAQKIEESMSLCDEVLASKSTDDPTLSAMMHVLRGLGRRVSRLPEFLHVLMVFR
jgi:hypothetical protein